MALSAHCDRDTAASNATLSKGESNPTDHGIFLMYKADAESVAENVRSLMRQIPHPLTVIVAQNPASGSPPTGLLVSSFNTVTLHPTPYVSFNLKLPSTTYDAIKASKTFTASAVADVQLAKDFLLDKKADRYLEIMRSNVCDRRHGMLKTGRGAIWWMRCRWTEQRSQPVGDHVIVVAEVLGASYYAGLDGQDISSEKALLYAKGEYRNAGPSIAEK
ncbi:MAG: hypothetical protein LQ337_008388 [Flavoplaca oasis]|nr:MAG: hypothetical protein LQ337_008388 [Flavoplaca oasis]